ncbi:MAG: AAA family ATPase [Lachnospiraceae bacterium]|nr:AAA family ATPase [Lachnospiraceae bacterium]
MTEGYDLLEVLSHIDPGRLSYQEWVNIGMALKEEGYSASDWDQWSMTDRGRYHQGECFRKWNSFSGAVSPVTGGTIVQMAKDYGWLPEREVGYELDWDSTINKDEKVIIDKNWIEGREIVEPINWDPKRELIQYLEVLFDSTENVGYVTHSFEKDGKYMPSKGVWDRTAGQLIQELNKTEDMLNVIGDYNPQAGAWIRFNPLDGTGIKNENVTEFKYALVESDKIEIEKQNAVIRELELPVACLVHSGGKSLHAVVRVDAADYQEYRRRVDYLYTICNKNGLEIDNQNRNPSRLSRMPGILRNGHKQFLVDTNIGKSSWKEWYEWIESVNDDLPEPESLGGIWENLPELSPPLIENVLRQGHKMLIAGPSKAGKSFALIELCCAIAEGRPWIGWPCTKGKIMYVNLELDRASCLHRFKDVYAALGWQPNHLNNIDIWNLRGKSIPMDKLAPKLIRRAAKKNYIAIIIDPIYKVITGDENSADQMANFCNQFDKVCTELNCAVIYCHHHSKGSQGGKRSMDRASGSGVFARDPDALLDLIELDLTEELLTQEENKAVCDACMEYLNRYFEDWEDEVSQDAMCSQSQMTAYCKKKLSARQYGELEELVKRAKQKVKTLTAWRIEGTLREFPKFSPVNLWFNYPIHRIDDVGSLGDIQPEDVKPMFQRGKEGRKKKAQSNREKQINAFEIAYSNIEIEGREVTSAELADRLGISKDALNKRLKSKDYNTRFYNNGAGVICRKEGEEGTNDLGHSVE